MAVTQRAGNCPRRSVEIGFSMLITDVNPLRRNSNRIRFIQEGLNVVSLHKIEFRLELDLNLGFHNDRHILFGAEFLKRLKMLISNDHRTCIIKKKIVTFPPVKSLNTGAYE